MIKELFRNSEKKHVQPEAFHWGWSAEPWREAPSALDAKSQARRAWQGAKRLTEARSADRTVKRSERSVLVIIEDRGCRGYRGLVDTVRSASRALGTSCHTQVGNEFSGSSESTFHIHKSIRFGI